ncbi:clasp N-terminal domain-containing protein [Cytidiella melzeri]|nr:clasp N-terminal domain-containing protein [Cytidiella melzeri]
MTPFQDEFQRVRDGLSLQESEDTWGTIAAALETFKRVVERSSSEVPQDIVTALRSQARAINNSITSERSRLSGTAVDLLAASATELTSYFDPLLPLFVPTLLALSSRPNKVFVSRARACLNTIISSTQSPAIIPFLVPHLHDKSVSLRLTLAEAALTCLNCANPPDLQKESRAKEVEFLIKATAVDADGDIRKYGRKLFDSYKILLPERVNKYELPFVTLYII